MVVGHVAEEVSAAQVCSPFWGGRPLGGGRGV
jgi:hypothetical protein